MGQPRSLVIRSKSIVTWYNAKTIKILLFTKKTLSLEIHCFKNIINSKLCYFKQNYFQFESNLGDESLLTKLLRQVSMQCFSSQ